MSEEPASQVIPKALLLARSALAVEELDIAANVSALAVARLNSEPQCAAVLDFFDAGRVETRLFVGGNALHVWDVCGDTDGDRIVGLLARQAIEGEEAASGTLAITNLKEILADAPVECQKLLVRILAETRLDATASQAAYYLRDEAKAEDVPILRDRFILVATNEGKLHPSIEILARMGDEACLPAIDYLLGSDTLNKNEARALARRWRKMIELQHPPSQLIEEIEHGVNLQLGTLDWAVDRACALGLDRERVREALFVRLQTVNGDVSGWSDIRRRLLRVIEQWDLLTEAELNVIPAEARVINSSPN